MKQLTSFLAVSFLVLMLFSPVQAGEISWKPRTPAGGAAIVDPDYYFQMLNKVEDGPTNHQITQTFDGHPFKKGYFEITDDGNVVYFDMDGDRIDTSEILIEDDPDNPPNGVIYYTAPRQVITY